MTMSSMKYTPALGMIDATNSKTVSGSSTISFAKTQMVPATSESQMLAHWTNM